MSMLLMSSGDQPIINWSFLGGALSSGISFSRASTGWKTNSSGILESVAENGLRFDHNPITHLVSGLIIEEQKQNLLTYSSDYTQSVWTKASSSISSSSIVAPNGSTMQKVTAGSSSFPGIRQYFTATPLATYTASIYAKYSTQQYFYIVSSNSSQYTVFDLLNGTIKSKYTGATPSITPVGGGIYRCSVPFVVPSGVTSAIIQYNFGQYSSDTHSGEEIYLWGAQIESGLTMTSHIPTTASTVTRAADIAQFTIPRGVNTLRYTLDDNSTQDIAVSMGLHTVPTTLTRTTIRRIHSI